MKIKCIAVDDEPLALQMVSNFVKQTPFLELSAAFDNAIDALHFIQNHPTDLLLLDIQMADLSGMQLARVLAAEKSDTKPYIIFTTAYSEYALEGYQVDAVDYLLKPFDYSDFLKAISRVKNRLQVQQKTPEVAEIHDAKNVFVKTESGIVRIETKDIIYVEGYKDYIKIHLSGQQQPLLSLMNLKKMEEQLKESGFIRIHRSYIISFSKVDTLLKRAVRIGDKMIPVGGNYRTEYDKFLERWTG